MLNTFHQTSKYSKTLHIFWWQVSTYFGSLALVKCFCILSITFVNKSINKSFPFQTTGGDLLPSWSLWHWSLPRKRFGFLKDAIIRQGQTWDLSKNYTAGSDKSHLWTRPLFPFSLFDDKIAYASFCLRFSYAWPKKLMCKLLLEIFSVQKSF